MALKNKTREIDKTVTPRAPEQMALNSPEHERSLLPVAALQRATSAPPSALRPADILALQHTIGNRAVQRMLSSQPRALSPRYASSANAVQRQTEEEEPQRFDVGTAEPIQLRAKRAPNRTGMPDQLKAGIESLSRMDLSDVRVHSNSDQPARIDALAYTQSSDIYIASGQEEHLPHEAWHVVQQRQGRVKPTIQARGVAINNDENLEREADVMSVRAQQHETRNIPLPMNLRPAGPRDSSTAAVLQGYFTYGGRRQRDVTAEIVSIFSHSEGFLSTLQDYRRIRDDNETAVDLGQWFYEHLAQRHWADTATEPRGDLHISISRFIGDYASHAYDAVGVPMPPPISSSSSGKLEVGRAEGVASSSSDFESKSSDKPSDVGPKSSKPLKLSGKTRFSHREEGPNIKVDVHDAETGVYLGVVTLQYNHDQKIVLPHTNAAEGFGGQGFGGGVYAQMMRYLLNNDLIPEGYSIEMSIVGGAMLHLQTRKFSERFGEAKTHAKGDVLGVKRKAEGPSGGEASDDLKAFKAIFIAEHMQYLRALAAAQRQGKLKGLRLHAQKALAGIKKYLLELGLLKGEVMALVFESNGPAILELLALLPEHADALESIYQQSLLDPQGVAVTFTLSRETLAQFVGFGFSNKLGWLMRKYL